jgi:hypothetical protein
MWGKNIYRYAAILAFVYTRNGYKKVIILPFFLVKSIYEGDITFAVSCVIFSVN